jgi:hypothetical protein
LNQRFYVKVDAFDPIFYKDPHMHEQYPISYQEHATIEEENVLFEGVVQAAATAKGMSRIRPFAFFIKDPAKAIGRSKRDEPVWLSLCGYVMGGSRNTAQRIGI